MLLEIGLFQKKNKQKQNKKATTTTTKKKSKLHLVWAIPVPISTTKDVICCSNGYIYHFLDCVVPENIQTPTTEGIGNSRGVGGIRGPGNSRREGGWTIKSLSRGYFLFDLSSNVASYRPGRSFLGHK